MTRLKAMSIFVFLLCISATQGVAYQDGKIEETFKDVKEVRIKF